MDLILNEDWEVLTENGFKPFKGAQRKLTSNTLKICFSDKSQIECTLNHKFKFEGDEFLEACKLKIGDVISEKIIEYIEPIEENKFVYDLIDVDGGHHYLTNDITSHNCAFIDRFQEFYSAVLPTITAGKKTKLIMASTPNGLNHYYKFWKDSEEGRNSFYRIYVPWYRVPGRDEKWKKETLEAMGNDQAKFDQEYGVEFLGSSGTLISGQALRNLTHITPLSSVDGLNIYEEPVKGMKDGLGREMEPPRSYAICCDVSRGKGLDYSAFSVIDITEMPYKQVCVYKNNIVPPVEYADIIYRIGKHYNDAVVLVEINDLGQQTVDHLFELEYDNILYTENAGRAGKRISIRGGKSAERGMRTTVTTKATGCALLKLLIEQQQLIINDFETIGELSRFSRKGNSYEAELGANDDLVMGLVLFAWLSDQQFFKELTDINTISRLRERSEEELNSQLVPLGILDTGIPEDFNSVGIQDIAYDSFDKWMME